MPKQNNTHKKSAAKMKFKTWDELVEENTYEPLEVEIDGETLVIETPTGGQIKELTEAGQDPEAITLALFGEEDGTKVLEAWDKAPAVVMQEFLLQVLNYFGLADAEGNPQMSSQS